MAWHGVKGPTKRTKSGCLIWAIFAAGTLIWSTWAIAADKGNDKTIVTCECNCICGSNLPQRVALMRRSMISLLAMGWMPGEIRSVVARSLYKDAELALALTLGREDE